MNILNKIFKIISGIIFAILVLIIIAIISYVIRINYLASQDRLGDIKTNFYTILTQSMHPNIKAGDIVITYKNDDDKYEKEDVITFISKANGGINITHRIKDVYIENGVLSYQTKGDNNNSVDAEIIPSYNVLGKVIFKIPKAGYIQQFLVSRTGWIIAIVLPSLGIIIYDILKLLKKAYGKQNKIDDEDEEIKKRKKQLENVLNTDTVEPFDIDKVSPVDPKYEISQNEIVASEVETSKTEQEEEIEIL